MNQGKQHKCIRCSGDLAEGVRFCVRCGTNNFDPDAGRLAAAQFEMDASERKKWWEGFADWYRYFMAGIRR
jgi:hypothetical protein